MNLSRCLGVVLIALSMLLIIPLARAHDLWLIPGATIPVGKPTTIRVTSGDDFPDGEHAPDVAAFDRRIVIRPDATEGTLEAAGSEDKSGLIRFEPTKPGVYVVAVQTKPKLITLEPEAFNAYLISDGMAHIYRLRQKEKILDKPGRERYSKSPKTLFQVGTGGKGDPCKVVGLPLEIVPLRNPLGLKPNDTLRVRVLFQGKPLPNVTLGWQLPGDGEDSRGSVRTDDKGEALIPIERTGLMTIRLTHMTRPKAKEYEWESFWTTLTFRVPE